MELLYLWVEEYNNIKTQGFNFSSKYKFRYENGEIEGEPNTNSVGERFFGDNITNITAIIGKNGSGKTTVLKILIDLLYNAKDGYGRDKETDKKYKFFVLFKIDNKINIYKSDKMEQINVIEKKYKIKIESENNKIFEIEDNTIKINEELVANSTIVLFDNFPVDEIEKRNEIEESNGKYYMKILTTSFLIDNNKNRRDDEKRQKNILYEMYKSNIRYRVLNKNIGNKKVMNSLFKENSLLKSKNKKIVLENEELRQEIKRENLKEVKMFIGDEKRREINYLEKNREILVKDFKMINSIIDKVGLKLNRGRNYLANDAYETKVKESLERNFATVLFRNDEIDSKFSEFLELKTSDELCKKAEEITGNKDYTKILNYFKAINKVDNSLNPKIELGAFLNIIKEHEIFKEIAYLYEFEYYNKDGEKLYLSSGEKQQLRIYSRIYSMIDGDGIVEYNREKDITKDNLIFLLDEPDIYMHPEWQRKFLSMFNKFIETTFENKKVQIILTSHSPFVVSDLPKENVIFLDKDDDGMCKVIENSEKKKTFGANIHTLLSDGFFMESTLGEFARSKISWVMEILDKDIEDIRKEEGKIRTIINMIGEPIIKNKLMKMLEDKLKLNMIGVDERIRRLEEEIKELRKAKGEEI